MSYLSPKFFKHITINLAITSNTSSSLIRGNVEDLLMVFGKKEYYLIVPAFWRDRIWTFDRSDVCNDKSSKKDLWLLI